MHSALAALAFAALVPCLAPPVRAATAPVHFTDVAASAAESPAIAEAVAQGLMRGPTATTFAPAQPVSFSDFAIAVQRMFALPAPAQPVAYTDLPSGTQQYAAIEAVTPYIHRQLLCLGCALGSRAQPDQPVTRAVAGIVLASILIDRGKIAMPNAADTDAALQKLTDGAALPRLAKPYFAAAIDSGVLTPSAAHSLAPRDTITRADTASLLVGLQSKFALPKPTSSP